MDMCKEYIKGEILYDFIFKIVIYSILHMHITYIYITYL